MTRIGRRLRKPMFRQSACLSVLVFAGALIASNASYGGSQNIPSDRAIAVALAFERASWVLSPFPRQVGRVACQIPRGGIAGGSVPGNCQTRVFISRRTFVTVAFTEAWDEKDFDGEGGTASGSLTHTWLVIESKKLKALDIANFGDFPPQYVR